MKEQAGFNFYEEAGVHIHKDYYPTPPALARRMAGLLSPDSLKTALEPSAGKGNLAEAVSNRIKHTSGHGGQVDVFEIVPELQSVLRERGFRVVGGDFLQSQGTRQYDAIVMNPPFSEGARHVLHAWGILYSGELVALINAETLRNPCTKERVLLCKIIADFGTVEYLEGAFVDAERTTNIDVALIHLKKTNKVEFDHFEGMHKVSAAEDSWDGGEFCQIALSGSRISNKVEAFHKSLEASRAAIIKEAEATYYRRMLLEGEERYESNREDLTATVKAKINSAVDELQDVAWKHIVSISEFNNVMTSKTRRDFEMSLKQVILLEFSVENIRQFLINLLADRGKIFNDCAQEVFDILTKYTKENRCYVEGWKSNDYFFVNKRVVIPDILSCERDFFFWNYGRLREMDDLDKVLAYMQGNQTTKATISDTIQAQKTTHGGAFEVKMESEHFYIRVYKKGTIHLYFKDLDALARFNLTVGRMRGWLPKEDAKVPKEFWLMNR